MSFRILALLIASLALLPAARAELPPSAYEEMQKKAPEVLRINVLKVDSSPESPEAEDITVLAEVVKVGRSETDLKRGELITITYKRTDRPKGWVGPGEIPLPDINAETVAFLKSTGTEGTFAPAAGAMTFSMF